MTLLQALLLGVVQGATEFLPISSSAHLVLVPWLLGWQLDPQAAFVFDVLVQVGTLVAVVGYFRRELVRMLKDALRGLVAGQPFSSERAILLWLILLSSLPAALLGLLIKPWVEGAFENPTAVSAFLLGTAALLLLSERIGARRKELGQLTPRDALWIGLGQVLSLFPGVSRSGATIAVGLGRDLQRAEAARFSFLMAVPVMLGAGVVAVVELLKSVDWIDQLGPLLAGFISAALVGYVAIGWLIAFLKRRPLRVFAAYCLLVGLGGLILGALRA